MNKIFNFELKQYEIQNESHLNKFIKIVKDEYEKFSKTINLIFLYNDVGICEFINNINDFEKMIINFKQFE